MPRKSNASDVQSPPEKIFINNYPAKLCHEHINGKSSISFTSISFMLNNAFASFLLPNKMIYESRRANMTIVPDSFTLFLGSPNEIRNVSVPGENGLYKNIKLTNQEIWETIEKNRAEYRAALVH